MGRYHVNHSYRSSFRNEAVALEADAEVELDDELAAWVDRDSPGCLNAVGAADGELTVAKMTKAQLIEHGTSLDPPVELHESQTKAEMLKALGEDG